MVLHGNLDMPHPCRSRGTDNGGLKSIFPYQPQCSQGSTYRESTGSIRQKFKMPPLGFPIGGTTFETLWSHFHPKHNVCVDGPKSHSERCRTWPSAGTSG
jgi:hypothetical protein